MKFPASLLPVLALSLGGCFAPPKLELPEKASSMAELEPYLERAVARKSPPGMTVAVIRDGETRYLKSFGLADGPRGIPASGQSVYQWWSVTKLFTATAVLQLHEDGKLDLDAPVTRYLPFVRFRGKVASDSAVTVRHLLSHSSGLQDVGMSILGWVHYDGDPHPDQTEFLKSKLDDYNEIEIEPGREGRYTNFGYLMLAALIEAVSGQSYEDYVRARILIPLGMDRTDFVYTPRMREHEAAGSHPRDAISFVVPIYIDMDRAVREKKDGIFWFNRVYSDQKGATGLIGSTEDLATFVKALMNGGRYGDVRILSDSSAALMRRPVVKITKSPAPDTEGMEFGLAWFIRREGENLTLSHGGSGMGFVAMVQVSVPRNTAVIVMANSTYLGRTMGVDLAERILELER